MECVPRARRRLPRALSSSALLVVAVFLAACTDATAPELSEEQANDSHLVLGERVYQDRCANCHGKAGGGGAGPKLSGGRVERAFPDPADAAAIVRNGRGRMPAWEDILSDEEIDAVVRYAREVL